MTGDTTLEPYAELIATLTQNCQKCFNVIPTFCVARTKIPSSSRASIGMIYTPNTFHVAPEWSMQTLQKTQTCNQIVIELEKSEDEIVMVICCFYQRHVQQLKKL